MRKHNLQFTKKKELVISQKIFWKILYFISVLLVIIFLGYKLRDKFLVATVNNQPVFKFQLTKRLYSRYGRQVLEDLIVENLILQEGKKRGISVSNNEIESALERIKNQLGQESDLETVLAFQGIKKEDFKDQLKIQILLEKLLGQEVTVSAEEIADFIKENKKQMEATFPSQMEEEAKMKLTTQKISQILNPWISKLVQEAKILRFLK